MFVFDELQEKDPALRVLFLALMFETVSIFVYDMSVGLCAY